MLVDTTLYTGYCETLFWGWRGEPLNVTTAVFAVILAVRAVYRTAKHASSQRVSYDVAFVACGLAGLLATNGLASALYHGFLYETFGKMDTYSMLLGTFAAFAAISWMLAAHEPTIWTLVVYAAWIMVSSLWLVLSLDLVTRDSDQLPLVFGVSNGVAVLLLVFILYRDFGFDEITLWLKFAFMVAFGGGAGLVWVTTEKPCQLHPSDPSRYFWGHSLFHVLVYSAFALELDLFVDMHASARQHASVKHPHSAVIAV
jgi:hypothetical protein